MGVPKCAEGAAVQSSTWPKDQATCHNSCIEVSVSGHKQGSKMLLPLIMSS